MKQLLEAGVHFGHQTRRWNPKMAAYIFTERNGIYIIDLQKTVKKLEEAYFFVRDTAAAGESILFVGTKKQAQDAIKEEAERCGQFFVNARWLGGMLTNFKTMRTRINRLNQLKKMQEDGTFDLLPKKEVIKLQLEIAKLEKYLVGYIRHKTGPGHNDFSDPEPVYQEPSNSIRWQKKAVVLTNRRSYSATNDFVNTMRQFPNVTTMGDTTGGGSGLPFSSEIPNGWSIRFSASPMFDPDMNQLEFGIEPDVKVDMTSEDMQQGKDTIIETAIKKLKN